MYHMKFRGTHYDIGRKYGSALRKNGKFILSCQKFIFIYNMYRLLILRSPIL